MRRGFFPLRLGAAVLVAAAAQLFGCTGDFVVVKFSDGRKIVASQPTSQPDEGQTIEDIVKEHM